MVVLRCDRSGSGPFHLKCQLIVAGGAEDHLEFKCCACAAAGARAWNVPGPAAALPHRSGPKECRVLPQLGGGVIVCILFKLSLRIDMRSISVGDALQNLSSAYVC